MTLSRRTVLKLSAGAVLAAEIFPGTLRAADRVRPDLRIGVVNDLHYFDEKCAPYFHSLVKKLNAADLDLVLLVGDVVEVANPATLNAMRDILKDLKAPLRVVPGNHDYSVDEKDPKDDTKVHRRHYDAAFADSVNYTFEHKGWQFVGLDTCDGVKWQKISAGKAMFAYLDATLPKLDKKRPMVLFTHYPLGEQDKKGYPSNPLVNAKKVLARFAGFNVRAVFNGHHHGLTERTWGDASVVTGPCCSFYRDNHDGTPEKGYFVVTSTDGKLTREFVDFTPAKAKR